MFLCRGCLNLGLPIAGVRLLKGRESDISMSRFAVGMAFGAAFYSCWIAEPFGEQEGGAAGRGVVWRGRRAAIAIWAGSDSGASGWLCGLLGAQPRWSGGVDGGAFAAGAADKRWAGAVCGLGGSIFLSATTRGYRWRSPVNSPRGRAAPGAAPSASGRGSSRRSSAGSSRSGRAPRAGRACPIRS